MAQRHLNFVCVCHVHRDILDEQDIEYLAREFVNSRSEIRRSMKISVSRFRSLKYFKRIYYPYHWIISVTID